MNVTREKYPVPALPFQTIVLIRNKIYITYVLGIFFSQILVLALLMRVQVARKVQRIYRSPRRCLDPQSHPDTGKILFVQDSEGLQPVFCRKRHGNLSQRFRWSHPESIPRSSRHSQVKSAGGTEGADGLAVPAVSRVGGVCGGVVRRRGGGRYGGVDGKVGSAPCATGNNLWS